ncbi:UNVERIFIED_CONTAM: 40S ribosomal protein S17 [Siphonaria sp. JEL0065]|nr:40S ribosomal protein S17 [Siphonaria sp. JEL0065]
MCFSSGIYAFVQAVAGSSYTAQAFILFIIVWVFSTIRTFNLQRYFVASLVAPLFTFSAITSIVGVAGRNTTNGALFDENFLISTLQSYMIGIGICTAVNLFVFPDFAEPHINELLLSALGSISELSSSVISCVDGSEIDKDSYVSGNKKRMELVAKIQKDLAAIDINIDQASAEISYSNFSIKNYIRLVKGCKSVAAVLFSYQTALSSASVQRLLSSPEFANHISVAMKSTWSNLDVCLNKLFGDVSTKINCLATIAKKPALTNAQVQDALNQSIESAENALLEFEQHQPNAFLEVFADKADIEVGDLKPEVKARWDKLLQVTFFILASKELVKEVMALHTDAGMMGKSRKIRMHLSHFIPKGLGPFQSHGKVPSATPASVRSKLAKVKNFVLSSSSIFGLKCAVALLCLQMVLYSRPDIFKLWYLNGSVISLLVTISPSMGQTYLGLPMQIFASALGSTIGYLGVLACGKTGLGIIGFSVLVSAPFSYLMFNPKTFVLGLLTLLSFSGYVCISNANSINPFFDKPEIYLAKTIGTNAITLSFAVIFSLVLYPTLARRILRTQMGEIFKNINIFYRKIVTTTVNVPEDVIVIEQDSDVKETRNRILSQLVALEPVMVFASAEPRLEGRFETEKYRELLTCTHRLLDRLECMRLSGGEQAFDSDVRKLLNAGPIGEVRLQMQQSVRLLLYVFASSMWTKQPLPPSLPKAGEARDKLGQTFVLTLMQHYHGIHPKGSQLEGLIPHDQEGLIAILNTEKWMRLLSFSVAAREVAYELDHLTPIMKSIFGEFPDIIANRESNFVAADGRVRTKTVKKASRVLIEKYYPRLTLDFQTNKKIADEVAIIASKRLRNKIAGFTTHLMKRIQKGPVRGISFKLQEEERERKDQYIPDVSALAVDTIEVDPETAALLKALNFENLPGVQVVNPQTAAVERVPGYRGPRAPRKQE